MARDTKTRTETDTFGPIEVPAEAYWGAQTQRSTRNFAISTERMLDAVIRGLAIVKRAAATVNTGFGDLKPELRDAIVQACR